MSTTSDTFNRAEDPLSSGWVNQFGLGSTKANGTSCIGRLLGSNASIYTTIAFSGSYQFSEVVADVVGSQDGGPVVFGRNNSTQMYLYDVLAAAQDTILKYNGSFNQLGAAFGAGLQAGHTYRIEVTSVSGTSTIITYDNGVTSAIRVDSTAAFTSGSPGLYIANSTDSFTSWNGGDSAAAAGGGPPTIFAYGDLSGIGSGGTFFKDPLQ